MHSDDIDLFMESFNSNWTCGCKSKTQKYIPSPVSSEYKLILNRKDSDSDYKEMYLEDFDENFDLIHSLKPDLKYYETLETYFSKGCRIFSTAHPYIYRILGARYFYQIVGKNISYDSS